jgi:hypothetical protein
MLLWPQFPESGFGVRREEGENRIDLPVPTPLLEVPMQVGGRLKHFWKIWQSQGADPWVVNVLRLGYNLEFNSKPPLSTVPLIDSSVTDPTKMNLLQDHLNTLLLKEAIEPVLNPTSPGFYSRLFLVPKKTGSLRPVIDLSALNFYF